MLLFNRFDIWIYNISCALLVLIIICIIATDIKSRVIPNGFILGIVALAAVQIIATCAAYNTFEPVIEGGLGFLTGLLISGAIIFISNGGMGAGDMKLFAALGAFFGIKNILEIICLSFVLAGLVYTPLVLLKQKSLKSRVAMAPYIGAAVAIVMLFQKYFDMILGLG